MGDLTEFEKLVIEGISQIAKGIEEQSSLLSDIENQLKNAEKTIRELITAVEKLAEYKSVMSSENLLKVEKSLKELLDKSTKEIV